MSASKMEAYEISGLNKSTYPSAAASVKYVTDAMTAAGNLTADGDPVDEEYAKWVNSSTIEGVSKATVWEDISSNASHADLSDLTTGDPHTQYYNQTRISTISSNAKNASASAQIALYDSGDVNHDSTNGFESNEHINHTSVTLTAGNGLTGGGTIAASREFNIGTGTGITVNTDDIEVTDYNTIVSNASDGAWASANMYALTDDLTADEISQIQNIDSVTINNTQWGYLGAMGGQPIESETYSSTNDLTTALNNTYHPSGYGTFDYISSQVISGGTIKSKKLEYPGNSNTNMIMYDAKMIFNCDNFEFITFDKDNNWIIINNSEDANIDFIIDTASMSNLLKVDASENKIGIKTGSPSYVLDVNGDFYATVISGGSIQKSLLTDQLDGDYYPSSIGAGLSGSFNSFITDPSTIISAGDNLSWEGNELNAALQGADASAQVTLTDGIESTTTHLWHDGPAATLGLSDVPQVVLKSGSQYYTGYTHSLDTDNPHSVDASDIGLDNAMNSGHSWFEERYYPSSLGNGVSGTVNNHIGLTNAHIDWTSDQGATNIHAGNYTDTNTTYSAGNGLELDSTTFNVEGYDNISSNASDGSWASSNAYTSESQLTSLLDDNYAALANGVTNGNSHDHSGGDGAQINHTTLSNIGSNSHTQIDSHISDGTIHNTSGTTALEWLNSSGSKYDTAYDHSQSAHAPTNADNTAANETSHADVVQDGDFTSNGLLKRTSAGVYGIVTDSSTNWDSAYSHISNTDNPHSVDKTDVSLGNVTNEAQIAKSIGTAEGDMIYFTAAGTPARLAKGTDNHVLTMNGNTPGWEAATAGFEDPMTTRGDIIYKNASNVTTRLGKGTVNQVIQSDGTDISWQTLSAGDITGLDTTYAPSGGYNTHITDLTIHNTSGTSALEWLNVSGAKYNEAYLYSSQNDAFTSTLKSKLDGIATGAEVNEFAFKTFNTDGTAIVADQDADTATIAGGTGITTAGSADTITITNSDTGTSAVTTHESTYNHNNYLLNNDDDTTTGTITAAGFTTAGTLTFNPPGNMTCIDMAKTDNDLIWKMGENTDNYGFYFKYEGTGAGDANYFYLFTENGAGTDYWHTRYHQIQHLIDISSNICMMPNYGISSNFLNIGGTTQITGILDEDSFASNSATDLATQQSIKSYVNTVSGNLNSKIGAGGVSTTNSPVDNDFAKFTDESTIEGRSYAEVRSDLGLEIGTDVLAQQTIGIANDNLVEIDDTDVASGDYAKFTTNGLQGRSTSEVKSDLSLNNVENTAISTWAGTENITTVGTITTGAWNGTDIPKSKISILGDWADGDISESSVTQYSSNMTILESQINDLSHYTDSDVDSHLAGGTGISYSNGTISTDLSDLSTSTTNGDGDYFVVVDTSNNQRKLTKANINLSGFNNDSEWTTNTGTVDTTGTISVNDFAVFTDSNTVQGLSYSDVRSALDLEAGTDFFSATDIATWRNSVTQTEMGYLHGVTSDIQTQLNTIPGKVDDLSDVTDTSPYSGQVLVRDSEEYVNTHPPMTFNIANVRVSANQNINVARFKCPTGKKAHIAQASACGSGGVAIDDLYIQMLQGSAAGSVTSEVYKTSSATIQMSDGDGYLGESTDGYHIEIRFMYSGAGVTGIQYGTGFMNVYVY